MAKKQPSELLADARGYARAQRLAAAVRALQDFATYSSFWGHTFSREEVADALDLATSLGTGGEDVSRLKARLERLLRQIDRGATLAAAPFDVARPPEATVDPQLASLVLAAESGEACPAVRLLVGGSLIVGWPSPSRDFISETWVALATEEEQARTKRYENLPKSDAFADALRDGQEAAREQVQAMRKYGDEGSSGAYPPQTLTLVGAKVLFGTSGVDLPVVRVPLSAIQAWWATGGKKITGETPFFFGALIPIPQS